MQDFLYIYSSVHKENWKTYLYSFLLTPIYMVASSLYVVGVRHILSENSGLLFHLLAVLGSPCFFTLLFIRINHNVAILYKKESSLKYWKIFIISQGISYILSVLFIFFIGAILSDMR